MVRTTPWVQWLDRRRWNAHCSLLSGGLPLLQPVELYRLSNKEATTAWLCSGILCIVHLLLGKLVEPHVGLSPLLGHPELLHHCCSQCFSSARLLGGKYLLMSSDRGLPIQHCTFWLQPLQWTPSTRTAEPGALPINIAKNPESWNHQAI